MKSLLIIASSSQMGGLQRAVVNVSDYFAANGYDVKLLLLYKQKHFYKVHPEIKIFEPQYKHSSRFKWLYYIYSVVFLRKTIREISPDRVLSFGELTNPLVLLSTSGTKYPVFISDRSSPLRKQGFLLRLLTKIVYGKAHGIIAQTQIAAEIKQQKFGAGIRIKVIHNILRDVKNYEVDRQKTILAVGRLYHVKGFDRLINAFALIADKCSDWNVNIVGGGPEEERLRTMIANYKLTDRILILPETKDIDRYLSTSSVFVMPSRSEGFPNALCEAMAAGLACASFNFVAGPSEIISNNQNGFLVPDGDIEAMADKLLELTANDALRNRIGKEAMLIREKLSYENTASLYKEFIFGSN